MSSNSELEGQFECKASHEDNQSSRLVQVSLTETEVIAKGSFSLETQLWLLGCNLPLEAELFKLVHFYFLKAEA